MEFVDSGRAGRVIQLAASTDIERSVYLTQNHDAIRLTFFFRLGYRNTKLHLDCWIDAANAVALIVDGGSDEDEP